MLLGNDQAEQPQIPQTLNEFRRLLRCPVPFFEILVPGFQVLVDGVEHHSQDFAVFAAQPRIREELLFENSPRHQILCDAHLEYLLLEYLLRDAIDQKIANPVAAHFVGQFTVQIAGRGSGLAAEGHPNRDRNPLTTLEHAPRQHGIGRR